MHETVTSLTRTMSHMGCHTVICFHTITHTSHTAITPLLPIISTGLVTSKSNALQLLVTLTKKVTSYLISYFSKTVISYFTSYYKLKTVA